MSQAKEVIEYIRDHGSITTMDAFGIGITRLASRVHDLRSFGIPVEKEMVSVLNRRGETCRVARYTIPGGVPDCFKS
jgi:hypothetical protein